MLKFKKDFGKRRSVGFSWSRSLDVFEFWGLLKSEILSGRVYPSSCFSDFCFCALELGLACRLAPTLNTNNLVEINRYTGMRGKPDHTFMYFREIIVLKGCVLWYCISWFSEIALVRKVFLKSDSFYFCNLSRLYVLFRWQRCCSSKGIICAIFFLIHLQQL